MRAIILIAGKNLQDTTTLFNAVFALHNSERFEQHESKKYLFSLTFKSKKDAKQALLNARELLTNQAPRPCSVFLGSDKISLQFNYSGAYLIPKSTLQHEQKTNTRTKY